MRITAAVIALVVAIAPERATGQHRQPLFGEIVDAVGDPVVGAELTFFPSARPALQCVSGWPIAVDSGATVHARSGHKGRFSVFIGCGPSAQGACGALVVRAGGIGALVLQPQLRLPAPIRCQQLAEVRLGLRGDVHVQALSVTGEPFDLGRHQSVEAITLPPGCYRLLISLGNRIAEHRIRIEPGESLALEAEIGSRHRIVELGRGVVATLYLAHWPRVPLPLSARGDLILPANGQPIRLIAVEQHRDCGSIRELWVGASEGRTTVGSSNHVTASLVIGDTQGRPLAGARLLCVRRLPSDDFELLSVAVSDENGQAGYVAGAAGAVDTQLIAVREGFAPAVVDLPVAERSVRLGSGHPFHLQVLAPSGESAAGVVVTLSWPDAPALDRSYDADPMGRIQCGDVPLGPVQVRVRDPRFVPETLCGTVGPDGPVMRIEARPGRALQGRVVLRGGRPAAGAVVTATDSTGELQPPSRVTLTGKDGTFTIGGLPEHLALRVSARIPAGRGEDARGYITSQSMMYPGQSYADLELRCEDPALPGAERDR